MIETPLLFILGAARSGTTWVNHLVRQHWDYGLASEAHWLEQLAGSPRPCRNLSDEVQARTLVREILSAPMFEHFRTVYSDYLGRPVDVTENEVWSQIDTPTCPVIVRAILSTIASQMGKSRAGNKNPSFWRVLPRLAQWFPDARFLHVVRDGRDVALSQMAQPWGADGIVGCATVWRRVLGTVARFRATSPRTRMMDLQYETLLRQPVEVADALSDFLGLQLDSDEKLRFVAEVEHEDSAQRTGKWRQSMSLLDTERFESLAGDELSAFGYERIYPAARASLGDRLERLARDVVYEAKSRFGNRVIRPRSLLAG